MAEFGVPGFFGKLPSRGDFVSRRLPPEFVTGWDRWLQAALAASEAKLGEQWLDVYLTSPIWCFALSPGICGDVGYAGVMIPSVDKVGRYFPLVAALPCGRAAPLVVRRELAAWYAEAQDLLLETLADPPLDVEQLDVRLANLGAVGEVTSLEWTPPATFDEPRSLAWRFLVAGATSGELDSAVLSSIVVRDSGRCGVWWTEGSERVGDCVLVVPGLPTPAAYGAMLDGEFDPTEWSCGVLHAGAASAPPGQAVSSAARSDTGKVRAINEDSFACRDDRGVWLVADGLGGHQAGDLASRMVASIADQMPASGTLEDLVECLRRNARVVNGCLRVLAELSSEVTSTGSTLAALIVARSRAAALWAGDSRVYRLRAGQLQQLTRDHAEEVDGWSAAEPHNRAVTRAVGGSDDLNIDVVYTGVQFGDRYLLCTDGLYTTINDSDIVRALSLDSIEHACDELQRIALEGTASDNVTAVIVHVAGTAERENAPEDGAHG